jgi:hypothetical protein
VSLVSVDVLPVTPDVSGPRHGLAASSTCLDLAVGLRKKGVPEALGYETQGPLAPHEELETFDSYRRDFHFETTASEAAVNAN